MLDWNNFILQDGYVAYEKKGISHNPKRMIILVHGMCTHGRSIGEIGRFLSNDTALFTFDLPGHGHSQGRRGDVSDRELIILLVDKLIEHAKRKYEDAEITLMGHSFGGAIVLEYLQRGSHRMLVDKYLSCSPWIRLVHKDNPITYFLSKIGGKITPHITINTGVDEGWKKDDRKKNDLDEKKREILELKYGKISLGGLTKAAKFGRQFQRGKVAYDEHALKKPLLVLYGKDDELCSYEVCKNAFYIYEFRNSSFIGLDNHMHLIFTTKDKITTEGEVAKIATKAMVKVLEYIEEA